MSPVNDPQAPVINAFTVDLEDWFQGLTSTNPKVSQWSTFESRVVAATEQLLRLLRTHQVEATFFVLGYVAEQHPALIEQIADDGHEIGVHGYHHRFVWQLTPAEFGQELDQGIQAVEQITGQKPLGHRAPYFSINARTSWAFDILRSRGLLYDSSVFPTRNMLYGFPDAPRFPYRLPGQGLMEYPLSTARLAGVNWPIAGGFYLRALPYAFIREGIAQLNRQEQPAIMYIHPWELDVGQTYRQITARERLTHYYGRHSLEKKLNQLFSDFRFCTLQTLLERPVTIPENNH